MLVGILARGQGDSGVYTVPRTEDGHPELQGIWQAVNAAAWNLEDHSASLGVPAGFGVVEGGVIPYQPWALARRQENFLLREQLDPVASCKMPGIPRSIYMPYPFQIAQTSEFVAFLFEFGHNERFVYVDDTPFFDDIPFWMGDARGQWEGDTLVVDVRNFNPETWFDRSGNFHSESLRVVERYTRTGPDHMFYEATLDDPRVFTRPWQISMPLYRRVEEHAQLLEYECRALSILEGTAHEEFESLLPDE